MTFKTFTMVAMLAAPVALCSMPLATAQGSDAPAATLPASDAPTQAGSTMYRWVDKDKTVHYSDRPQPGAESIPVPSSQTYTAPQASQARAGAADVTPIAAAPAAQPAPSCDITSPGAGQVFPNAQSVTISYRGPAGGRAELLLDGTSRQTQPAGQAFTISPVPRGTYSAAIAITSDSGVPLCRTSSVTFYVTQPSLLSPARQQQNRPQPR